MSKPPDEIVAGSKSVKDNSAYVVAALALPPPMNGQSLINASVLSLMKCNLYRVKVINTSPGLPTRSVRYHLRRAASVAIVPFVLLANALSKRRSFYTVAEPGYGMLYHFVMVAFARCCGFAIFLHHHAASYTKVYDRRFALLCRCAGREATHIALSADMAADLKRQYGTWVLVIVVHNAGLIRQPENQRRERHGDDRRNELRIGFLSNLSVDKGLDTVIAAFRAIRQSGLAARLILAGPIFDDVSRSLIDRARDEYSEEVVEVGPVSDATKDNFFDSIDLFLFPSRYRLEAQPLVVLEALSFGIPAISTLQGYTEEILRPLKTAVESSAFIEFSIGYAGRLIRDPIFKAEQGILARARFADLAEMSQRQLLQLLALLAHT